MPDAPTPTLFAETLRIDVGGVPAVEGLSFSTTATNVILLGAPEVLFDALVGLANVGSGTLMLANPAEAAPLDPPLPAKYTVRKYVESSALLAGQTERNAYAALEALELVPHANAVLGTSAPQIRRATVIAAALATGKKTLILEDPTQGLPDDIGRHLAHVICKALKDSQLILFSPHLPLDSPFAMHADEAIVFDRSRVCAQGAPAEIASRERDLAVRFRGDGEAFTAALIQRGIDAHRLPSDPADGLTITLKDGVSSRDIVVVARECGAIVLSLRPVSGAFA